MNTQQIKAIISIICVSILTIWVFTEVDTTTWSKSGSIKVLNDCGELYITVDTLEYTPFMDEYSELELKALAELSDVYVITLKQKTNE